MRIPEFYPTKQGRPASPETRDLETGQTSLYSSYNALWEEYVELKDLLDKLLNEQIQKLEQLVIEARQTKLHLADMSDEDISDNDIEED